MPVVVDSNKHGYAKEAIMLMETIIVSYIHTVFLLYSLDLYSSCQATNGRFGLAVPVMILRGSVRVVYIP